jgi:acyl-coenzyme A thioesterase PaaI-like protein
MRESLRSGLTRRVINLLPAYFGTGGRLTYVADDWREVRLEIPLTLRTRNYVGTIFGGSMYGAVDPVYMVMLIKNLGPDYDVWDKSATIRFKRPGRTTLHARFLLTDEELRSIEAALATEKSVDRVYDIELTDARGVVHATVEKTVYIAKRRARASRPAKES